MTRFCASALVLEAITCTAKWEPGLLGVAGDGRLCGAAGLLLATFFGAVFLGAVRAGAFVAVTVCDGNG